MGKITHLAVLAAAAVLGAACDPSRGVQTVDATVDALPHAGIELMNSRLTAGDRVVRNASRWFKKARRYAEIGRERFAAVRPGSGWLG